MIKILFVTMLAPAMFAQTPACAIKVNAVGPIKAGMTIRAARLALPGSVWKQQDEPGGSVSFFAVMRGGKHFMDIYPDQEEAVKETSKIELLRVFDPACTTVEGVHPGMPLIEVEAKFGNLKKMILEQSEKREYAQFEKQPNWIDIQAGSGEVGLYNSSELCSHGYKQDAKVESLWVSHPIEHKVLDDDQFCKVPDK